MTDDAKLRRRFTDTCRSGFVSFSPFSGSQISGAGDKQIVTLNARASLKEDRAETTYAMAETNTQWVITRDSNAEEGMSIALAN